MDSGSTVVTVKTPESHIAKVMEILESHKPIDIDERATSYGLTQTQPRRPVPPADAGRPAGTDADRRRRDRRRCCSSPRRASRSASAW